MTKDPTFVIWIVGGILAVVGAGVYLAWRYEKQRTAALSDVALRMGFRFAERDDSVLVPGFPLFERGRGRKAKNVMMGTSGGRAVTLFDYWYTTGGGKSSQTHSMSVALYEGFSGLPPFDMAPENFLTRIANAFGWQDIDFDANPEFSNAYLLRSPEEAAVRAAFRSDVLSFFAAARDWSVHAHGGRLAVMRALERRCKPEDVQVFLDDCGKVAGVFAHVHV